MLIKTINLEAIEFEIYQSVMKNFVNRNWKLCPALGSAEPPPLKNGHASEMFSLDKERSGAYAKKKIKFNFSLKFIQQLLENFWIIFFDKRTKKYLRFYLEKNWFRNANQYAKPDSSRETRLGVWITNQPKLSVKP